LNWAEDADVVEQLAAKSCRVKAGRSLHGESAFAAADSAA
jgi:hypothetical protein